MLTWLHRARARASAFLTLLITVALASALAGCGGSSGNGVASKSAGEILAASRAAAVSATSVHVASKNSQGRLSFTLNLELASNGGRGKISGLGLAYEVIRVGNALYLKGTPAFYERLAVAEHLGAAAAHVPQGAWLKAPANGPLAQLASFTDLRGELGRLLSTTNPVVTGHTTTVNGQKAIELRETAKLFTGSLFIATTGKAYPIEIVKHGRETGQITFSGWNRPITLTAPGNAIAIR